MTITDLFAKVEQLKSNLFGRSQYPGYRMTKASNARWDKIEQAKVKTQKDWEETERQERARRVVINKARQMIEWAVQSYTSESLKLQKSGNMHKLTNLRLYWSAQRVLSTHKDFTRLCDALKDERIWKMLSRKERAFLADAVGMKK